MKIEIERKFLVDPMKFRKALGPRPRYIVQGYLSTDPLIRVRTELVGKKSLGWLTIKGKGLTKRPEYEYKIPYEKAASLLNLCGTRIITKNRYKCSAGGGLVWEIDEFLAKHKGLWVAEIELEHENQVFRPPPWLGREVSADFRYQNAFLASHEERFWEE